MTLSPFPMLLAFIRMNPMPPWWRLGVALSASFACFVCAITLFRRPLLGKFSGWVCAVGSYGAAFPFISANPFAALLGSVLFISVAYALFTFKIHALEQIKSTPVDRRLQRARWATLTVPVIVITHRILNIDDSLYPASVILFSSLIAQVLFAHWASGRKPGKLLLWPSAGISFSIGVFCFSGFHHLPSLALLISLATFVLIPRTDPVFERWEPWWELFLNHPARLLLTTFFLLCFSGTLLLTIPASTHAGAIGVVDAMFTAVSAVCVTGLIVLDTPHEFTVVGQLFILVLIQLGGLGIMSITTVALHTMGRRLSLKQVRLMTSFTDTSHKDLIHSLATILRVTFLVEGVGALFLFALFYSSGDSVMDALWQGVFTAISAFCNAGFTLQSDNLIPFQNSFFILHTISALIILGGLAPATALLIPNWVRGRQVPISARITLITSAVLLFTGTFFFLTLEWNGVLAGLTGWSKLQNAWFQSVTLRTAGFNSVDITHVTGPTLLVMLCCMFIGGSPGSTAGGVKTTTMGILAMTFWATITNRTHVILHNRRIPPGTIFRAITIVASFLIVWFLVVLMLQVTQQISARDIIFEATSAIGTVGLSTGATPRLDEIGKLIIMIAMFAGRIGPMTLFMFLSDDPSASGIRCPDAKISLT